MKERDRLAAFKSRVIVEEMARQASGHTDLTPAAKVCPRFMADIQPNDGFSLLVPAKLILLDLFSFECVKLNVCLALRETGTPLFTLFGIRHVELSVLRRCLETV